MTKFTEEQKQFIYENYRGIGNKELTNKFNQKFNTNLDKQIIYFKRNHHLNSGLTGQFEKGHISQNKGKKWDDYMSKEAQEKSRKTTFKKGNAPHNRKSLFEERIGKDGYIEIKIQDGCLNKNWQQKQRYVYEQYFGKIPNGYKVIFLDGDIYNFDIDNLKMISSEEELIMNKNNLRYNKKELTETGYLITKIISKRGKIINDIKKANTKITTKI